MKPIIRLKKFHLLLWCVLFGVLLSGCTPFVGVDSLLAPPQLEGDQQEIYTALNRSVSGEIEQVYPLTGKYKSAITLLNIDQEDGMEAVAFYRQAAGTSGQSASQSLRVNILDRREDKWVSVYDMGVDADEVEKIDLLRSDDGSVYLAIGYTYTGTSEKRIGVYRFYDNILTPIEHFRALTYEVCDIDGDGGDEIVKLISVQEHTKDLENTVSHVEAKLIQVRGTTFVDANQVLMTPSVTEYTQTHFGTLSNGVPAIYLDALIGTQMISEILYCDENGMLQNLLYDGTQDSLLDVALTQRPSGIYSMDIYGDGCYEIPQVFAAPGYEQKERYEQVYFTTWNSYSSNKTHRSTQSYTDFTLGYIFQMPVRWNGRVTAEISTVDNEVVFYEYDPDTGERGVAILSLRIMSRAAYSTGEVSGKYQRLLISGQFVFLYYAHNDISSLSLSEEQVRKNLYLLN